MPQFPQARLREAPGGLRESLGGSTELVCLGLAASPAQCFCPALGLPWPQSRTVMKPLIPVLSGVTVLWEVVTPKKVLDSADLVSSVGQPARYPRREEGLRPIPGGRTPKCGTVHSALQPEPHPCMALALPFTRSEWTPRVHLVYLGCSPGDTEAHRV